MRRAFTLIELLVVVAILAILAAILFPVFARAKLAAKSSACVSNLKQIGGAITMYMQDYDDVFPAAVDPSDKYRPEIWDQFPEFKDRIPYMPMLHEALQPYVKSKQVFKCPADTGSEVLDTHPFIEFKTAPSTYATYGTSYMFRTEIAFKYFSQSQFKLPADVNVLFDSSGHWHSANRGLRMGDPPGEVYELLTKYRYNTLFGDMHVKSITYSQMQQAWQTEL